MRGLLVGDISFYFSICRGGFAFRSEAGVGDEALLDERDASRSRCYTSPSFGGVGTVEKKKG